ncbi:MAG: PAS domain S-box protein [Deltaproteobacteria bacterium]|nr:PAS domain S-box protein [Deltaproteobacteria bacterium]
MTNLKTSQGYAIENGERFRHLYENATDLIYLHDLDWKIVSVNPSVQKVLGYTVEEVIGRSILEFIPPYLVPQIRIRLKSRLEKPQLEYAPLELIVCTKDGREKWFDIKSSIMTSPDGVPIAVQGIARDITDRKRMEEELRESEQEYRAIFENTHSAMCILEEDNILSLVNSEFTKLSGCAREEVEGRRTWMSFVDPKDLQRMRGYHESRMKGEYAPRNYEFRFTCKNEGFKHVFVTVAFITGTRRRVISLTDLTDRKRADEILKVAEARYRAFLDATSDSTYLKDENFRYLFANRPFLKICGFSEEGEILGKSDDEIDSADFVEIARRSEKLALNAGKRVVVEERLRNMILEARKFPVPLQNGKMGVGALIRNITEMRQAEEEKKKLEIALERAGKMEALGTLAGGVAHDLNNVLGGVVSLPELLMMELPDDNPMKKSLGVIKKSGEKAAAIVQDMLTLTRRGVSNATVVSLNEIVSKHFKTPEQQKLQFYHPNAKCEICLDDHLLNILGSPVHLSKTLMNLLSNAAEAMPEGGTVTITTENRYVDKPISGYDDVKKGDYAVLTVSDTGMGISSDQIDRIFEPFYTKKVMGRSGTGLGMTVVWGTVKDHNGYIDVQSKEGKGTTITIYFPVTRKTAKKERDHASIEDLKGKGQKILIVDDAPDQLELASKMLSTLGYETATAQSGEIAVRYLQKHSVELVVLDMIMDPGIDGLETYRRILEKHPGQKAIITSGYSKTERIRAAQKLGAGAYVKKPYLLEKMAVAVLDELEGNK